MNYKLNFSVISTGILTLLILIYHISYSGDYDVKLSVINEKPSFKQAKDRRSDYNIFFIETNHKRDYFTARQMCAIESAAKHNAHASVNVYSLNAKFNQTYLFEEYSNIQLNALNVSDMVLSTPLDGWWKNDKLNNNDDYYRFAHLSDALRMLVLYKFSGFYLDLDIITLNSYKDLSNFTLVAIEDQAALQLGNAFLSAEKMNETFLHECLKEFAQTYDPNSWVGNGLGLLHRVVNRHCGINGISQLMTINISNDYPNTLEQERSFEKNNNQTCSVHVLPFYSMFPSKWQDAHLMFDTAAKLDVKTFLYSKGVHFNNKVTDKKPLKRHDRSVMEFLFKFNCPFVYEFEIK